MGEEGVLFEEGSILVRSFKRRDSASIVKLLRSNPEATPMLFYDIKPETMARIIVLRHTFEKYIDRLRHFFVALSVGSLVRSTWDRKILVAMDTGTQKLVGAAFVSNVGGTMWSLDIIVVDALQRGKHVGSVLLECVIGAVRKAGGNVIITSTGQDAAAMNFYLRSGFKRRFDLTELELRLS